MKELFGKLSSRGSLIAILVIVILIFAFFVFSVSHENEITVEKGKIHLIPKNDEQINNLLTKLSKCEDKYDELKKNHLVLKDKYYSLVIASDSNVYDSEDVILGRVTTLSVHSKEVGNDVHFSLSVIKRTISNTRTINTNSISMNREICDVYKHIQKFLRCVGVYNGKIDGKRLSTCNAVRLFQENYGLEIDGIIGERTLCSMEKAFDEAKSH